mmetsp:Transcript_22064/g.38520  ORF Transcript_22064/g.38520 Transcript_22064/m.38520 type:complete len:115 (+) Transcript_22064:197-541(+)
MRRRGAGGAASGGVRRATPRQGKDLRTRLAAVGPTRIFDEEAGAANDEELYKPITGKTTLVSLNVLSVVFGVWFLCVNNLLLSNDFRRNEKCHHKKRRDQSTLQPSLPIIIEML